MKWLIVSCILLVSSSAFAEEITLAQAMERLEEANEDWEVAQVRVERSRAFRREAMSRLLPQLSVGAATTYNGQEVQFGDSIVRRQVDWGASAAARVTLLDLAQYPLVAAAGKQVEVFEAQGVWTRRSLQYEVEATFYELAAAQRDVEISAQTIDLRQVYVERATALESAGVALPLDVARARAQLLEAQQLLLEATARLGNRADALAVLIGIDPVGELRAVTDGTLPAPPQASGTAAERSDLEADRLNIESLDSVVTSRWWALAPTLALQGDVNAGPPSFTSPDVVTWSVTLSVAWLLYDGGARYARIDIANADLAEASLELSRAERVARAELLSALRNWRAAFEAVEVAQQQVEVAKLTYEMTSARFEAGIATSIEVVEASDTLFRARSALSSALLAVDTAASRWRYLQ